MDLTAEEEIRAKEVERELGRIREPSMLRHTLAKVIARLESVHRRTLKLRDTDPLLQAARYRRRTSDRQLVFTVPGLDTEFSMRLSSLRSLRPCATCAAEMKPGDRAYTPGWTSSNWLRAKRICYACAEAFSPPDMVIGGSDAAPIDPGVE